MPYRTSFCVAARYDGEAVAVEADFARHGAPLVWRGDRWKAHVTPAVSAVLAKYGVLLMHGPPHCPRFYGQLERQNRRLLAAVVSPAVADKVLRDLGRLPPRSPPSTGPPTPQLALPL